MAFHFKQPPVFYLMSLVFALGSVPSRNLFTLFLSTSYPIEIPTSPPAPSPKERGKAIDHQFLYFFLYCISKTLPSFVFYLLSFFLSWLNAQRSTLNTQCSTNAQCSTLNAQCSMLNTQHSMLNASFQILVILLDL